MKFTFIVVVVVVLPVSLPISLLRDVDEKNENCTVDELHVL